MSAGSSTASREFNKVADDVKHVDESNPRIDDEEESVEEEAEGGDAMTSRKKKLEELRKRMVRIGLHLRSGWVLHRLPTTSRDRRPKRIAHPSLKRPQKRKSRRARRRG